MYTREVEGWVVFDRIHFKEGHVDRCLVDAAHNPNEKQKRNWCLNSFTTYFRLNGGEWIIDRGLQSAFHSLTESDTKSMSAVDWYYQKIKQNK
jgi:hypothetical protein